MPEIQDRANGTAFSVINNAGFRPIFMLVPGKEPIDGFSKLFQPLLDRITSNLMESETLAEPRDMLLPPPTFG